MNALIFKLSRTVKNGIIDLIKHPSKLILYLFTIGMISFSVVMSFSSMGETDISGTFDIRILHGILLAVYLLIGGPVILTGLKSGTTFFDMGDVNFSFVSPLSSHLILIFSLVKQLGISLWLMVCFISLTPGLINAFSLTIPQAVITIVSVVLFIFLAQIFAMLFYIISNGNPRRINIIKWSIYLCVGFIAFVAAGTIIVNGLKLETIYQAVSHPLLEYVPLFGWAKAAVVSVYDGNYLKAAIFGGLILISTVTAVFAYVKMKADYYEDVLQNTESTHEMKKAVKNGKMSESMLIGKRRIKVKSTGINGGKGASALFFKHMREAQRRSNILFFNINTIVLLMLSLLMTFIFISGGLDLEGFAEEEASDNSAVEIYNAEKTEAVSEDSEVGEDDFEEFTGNQIMAIVLAMCSYLLFFFNSYGDWSMELMRPYIYLIPVSPFKKLIWASAASIVKPFVDGILIFGLIGIICGADLLTIIMAILIYTSFSGVYTSSSVASQRLLGSLSNRGAIMFLYILMIGLIIMPGGVGTIFMLVIHSEVGLFTGALCGLPVLIWNVIATFAIFFFSRNTLHNLESGCE